MKTFIDYCNTTKSGDDVGACYSNVFDTSTKSDESVILRIGRNGKSTFMYNFIYNCIEEGVNASKIIEKIKSRYSNEFIPKIHDFEDYVSEPVLGKPPKGRSQTQHNHLMSLNKKKRN